MATEGRRQERRRRRVDERSTPRRSRAPTGRRSPSRSAPAEQELDASAADAGRRRCATRESTTSRLVGRRRCRADAARHRRFVYAAYFAGAIGIAFLAVEGRRLRLGDASPSGSRRSASRATRSSCRVPPLLGALAAVLLLGPHARAAARRGGRDRAVEGHLADAARRSRTRTFVVIVDDRRVDRLLRADGPLLGFRHQSRVRD